MDEVRQSSSYILSLWAKSDPYHPLWCHMLDVAAVCEALLPRFGTIEDIPTPWILYLAALHDIGKADPLFQIKSTALSETLKSTGLIFPEVVEPFRHEARSFDWVLRYLRSRGWGTVATRTVAQAIRGHHGDFRAPGNAEEIDAPVRFAQWEGARNELAAYLADALGVDSLPYSPKSFENTSSVGIRLTGLIVLSDWIASNEELFRYHTLNRDTDTKSYWNEAQKEAEHAVGTLALGSSASYPPPHGYKSFADVWPECSMLRPSQTALEDACFNGVPPGLAIIEAPMGEGKTEAAIYLSIYWNESRGRSGAYIALPTMTTSNQMHNRYGRFIERYIPGVPSPYLVHGMSWLMDDSSPNAGAKTYGDEYEEETINSREWFSSAKRALIAPEGVGTIDQALMSALNVKHGFLRLLGLSTKTLIIDEVHAYDQYMYVLMEKLLEWCGALKIPVIMLSATLSNSQKQSLVKAYRNDVDLPESDCYPLLTFVPLEGEPVLKTVDYPADSERVVHVRNHSGLLDDPAGTARLALESVRDGGCACVLANTVKSAQEIFRELQQSESDALLYLFHARFRAERRMEKEDEVVSLFGRGGNRPKKAILVATQVVEQSLDLDFDVMISQIAPVDLLLQRSGRLHRHQRGARPTGSDAVLHVLHPPEGEFAFGSTGKVYHPELLLRTLALLHGKDAFYLPRDFRPLIEGCYGGVPIPAGIIPDDILTAAARDREEKQAEARSKALTHLIPDPSPRTFRLAEMSRPVSEGEDEDRTSFFRAQTRLGDDSRAVLVLRDPKLIEAAQSKEMPRRELLKRLFLQKATVPGWWLKDLTPVEGFNEIFEGPKWLRGHKVIPMQAGVWKGVRNGKASAIIDDKLLGLELKEE